MKKLLKRGERLGLVATAIFLAGALLMGSIVPVKAAEEKVVRIGNHAVYTGGGATTIVPGCNAVMDCARYINEQNGIDGVKVKIDWEETAAQVPRSVIAHRRFRERGAVMELNWISGPTEVLTPTLQKDEIPIVLITAYSPGMLTQPVPWVFTPIPSLSDHGAAVVYWFMANWTKERPPRIGALIYDQVSGWEILYGMQWACRELGIEFVGYECLPFLTCIDSTTEWLRLAGKNPDLVFPGGCGMTVEVAIKDAARLEIAERGMTLVASGYCLDVALPVVGKAAEGWYSARPFPTAWETELPGMEALVEAAKRYRGHEVKDIRANYVTGWAITLVMIEGIRMAMERVGFENLTGRAVRDGLASLEDFDIGLVPPITMSDSKPYMLDGQVMYQVQGGRLVRVSDLIEFPGLFPGLVKFE